MATLPATQLKRGMTIDLNGKLHSVVELTHVTPGNKRGIVHAKLRNVQSQSLVDHRFRSADTVPVVHVDASEVEYLYEDSTGYTMMDPETYDQFTIPKDVIGDQHVYLIPNIRLRVQKVDEQLVSVDFPGTVVHEIKDTGPAIKGATVTNQYKPAITETGLEVQVPPFVKIGDRIKIDTQTGQYLERAKEE